MAEEPMITLRSNQGAEFRVPKKVVAQSGFLANMLDDEGEGDSEEHVPLPQIKSSTLQKVLEYLTH